MATTSRQTAREWDKVAPEPSESTMRAAKPARRIEPQLISPSQAARAAQAFAAATTSGAAAAPKGPAPALQQLSLREQAAYSDAHPEVTRRFYVELTSECTEVNYKKVRALQPWRGRCQPLLCSVWSACIWQWVSLDASDWPVQTL